MSAICGILYTDRRTVEHVHLERMLTSLAHRGRDGSGCWHEGAIGLGHRMFRTTPESLHETLPYVDPRTQLAITADARIDNRDDIFRSLGLSGVRRAEMGDSRLILAAYERWGDACVTHLEGDFAFAIWDAQQRRLFCARDRFGVKPFFYYHQHGVFLFAAEIKALLTLGISPTVNEDFIAGYLLPLYDNMQATVYREILRFPPAHSLVLDADGASFRRYWRLDTRVELRLRSDAEYAEAFRAVFTEAVSCRLRSAFPVGSMLSGGMDSSSITCMARQLLVQEGQGRQLHTYSAIFPAYPACDERQYMHSVLAQGGVIPHQVPVDQFAPYASYCQGQRLLDEPYFGSTMYLHWGIMQTAQGQVRVLCDGFGGDSIISHGLTSFTELATRGHWRTLYSEARAFAVRHGWPLRRLLWEQAISPAIPAPLKRLWHALRRHDEDAEAIVRSLIAPALRDPRHLLHRLRASQRQYTRERQEQRAELEQPLYAHIFDWVDPLAAAHQLEMRYPFFDRRVAEFCLSLPITQKLQQGWTRMILRRAMDGLLPPAIQWRAGKADLSPAFCRNLLATDQRQLIRTITASMETLAPYVQTTQLQTAFSDWFVDEQSIRQYWYPIWCIATLAAWLQCDRGMRITEKEVALISA